MTAGGLYVPLITPFDDAGRVDPGALDALARQVLADGATGLVALGTTAEPATLTDAERALVLDVVARVCRERAAELIVGANTEAALGDLSRWSAVTGALTLVPPFVRPGEAAAVAHLGRLAAASPVPVLVYHVPYRTGQPLSERALRQLAATPNVCGVKLSVGGIDADTVALLADVPPGFAVLAGDDVFVSALLALGGHGGILASAHVATAEFAALVRAWRAGDAARGRALGHRLAPLSAALFAEPNPAVVKAVLHAQGRIATPAVRPPLLPASAAGTATALRYADRPAPLSARAAAGSSA
ncbi:dihydrodipicolinate synthase family protein [Plantactinospora sp. KBS50]|uniref:dihydrodipicolinate synthase family protein n=1 Tax=Plantactinospora sp. KBS50 TaxID=2024580 RepID=UPI000BAB1FD1|nr:dihydrodipicolinate synthase family protein [Plantactinospora sp. KBS50]ASW53938.1 4-hydroxy-tetrahydrodipicolinate synthase [Plantactinospora sp. KBS50]